MRRHFQVAGVLGLLGEVGSWEIMIATGLTTLQVQDSLEYLVAKGYADRLPYGLSQDEVENPPSHNRLFVYRLTMQQDDPAIAPYVRRFVSSRGDVGNG